MDVKVRLKTPSIPNFITVELPSLSKQRQDGFKEAPKIDIADLTNPQLNELAAEWKRELLEAAIKRRASRALDLRNNK